MTKKMLPVQLNQKKVNEALPCGGNAIFAADFFYCTALELTQQAFCHADRRRTCRIETPERSSEGATVSACVKSTCKTAKQVCNQPA